MIWKMEACYKERDVCLFGYYGIYKPSSRSSYRALLKQKSGMLEHKSVVQALSCNRWKDFRGYFHISRRSTEKHALLRVWKGGF